MIILGKLGKDFENITKATGKKTTTRATLRKLKIFETVNFAFM